MRRSQASKSIQSTADSTDTLHRHAVIARRAADNALVTSQFRQHQCQQVAAWTPRQAMFHPSTATMRMEMDIFLPTIKNLISQSHRCPSTLPQAMPLSTCSTMLKIAGGHKQRAKMEVNSHSCPLGMCGFRHLSRTPDIILTECLQKYVQRTPYPLVGEPRVSISGYIAQQESVHHV